MLSYTPQTKTQHSSWKLMHGIYIKWTRLHTHRCLFSMIREKIGGERRLPKACRSETSSAKCDLTLGFCPCSCHTLFTADRITLLDKDQKKISTHLCTTVFYILLHFYQSSKGYALETKECSLLRLWLIIG